MRSNEQIVRIYMHLRSRTFCSSDSWIKKIWWSRTISISPHSDDIPQGELSRAQIHLTDKHSKKHLNLSCATLRSKKTSRINEAKVPLVRFALLFALPQGTPKFEHVFPKCTMFFKEQKSTSIFAAERSVAKK
jgi:hypothetical protein